METLRISNWKFIGAIILLVLTAAWIAKAPNHDATAAQHSRTPTGVASGPFAPDAFMASRRAASLDEQKKCADEARAFIQQQNTSPDNWQDHYDQDRGHCFADLFFSYDPYIEEKIEDPFENKLYGHFLQGGPKPLMCWVLDVAGKLQNCSSEDDFDKLKKAYIP